MRDDPPQNTTIIFKKTDRSKRSIGIQALKVPLERRDEVSYCLYRLAVDSAQGRRGIDNETRIEHLLMDLNKGRGAINYFAHMICSRKLERLRDSMFRFGGLYPFCCRRLI